MTPRRLLLLLGVLTALLVAAAPASAANVGEFQIDIVPPGAPDGTEMPDCTPSVTEIGATLATGGGPVSATCTMKSTVAGKTATGTVSNATLAATDPGFGNGTISLTCDSAQDMTMGVSIATTGSQLKSLKGTILQACSFAMAFQDAQASTMAGTVELNGTIGTGDGTISGDAVEVTLTAKVYVTGGTGQFEGQVGGGTFTQQQSIPVAMNSGTNAPPSGGAPSAAEQAVCDAVSLSPCTPESVTQICGNAAVKANPAAAALCTAAGRRLWITPRLHPSVRADGNTMTLNLVKKAGAVRILSPTPPAGKRSAAAKVTAKTKIRVVATKGAQCTVRTNTGAVVGSKTSTSSSKAFVIRPKAGSLTGAKSITASCTLGGGSFASQKVRIAST